MIDLRNEPLIPLGDVPKLKVFEAFEAGKRICVTTLWRWANHGIGGRKLETIKLGGRRYTSFAALERFVNKNGETGLKNRASTKQQKPNDNRATEVKKALDTLKI